MIKLITSAVVAGVLLATPTKGADKQHDAMHNGVVEPLEFIKVAGKTDEFERETGKLAAQRGASSEVRDFGQQMVKDHTQTTQDLMQAAKEAGLNPPAGPPSLAPDQKKELQMLGDADKAEFDALYLAFQAKAHDAALGLMKGYAANGTNEVLAKAAGKTAPMVKEHLNRIHEIQGGMK
jgi:putative membrane protein